MGNSRWITSCDAPEDRATASVGVIANPVDYTTLAQALADDCRTVSLDERTAIGALSDGAVDLLIISPRSDWWAELPSIVDVEAEARRAHVTVLAMVPRGDTAALALAFDSGVADCAAYPFDQAEIVLRVRALLRRKRVADRRRADAAESRRLAFTDPVTGLWNRHYFDADLAAKIDHAAATATPLSLLMIDIDRFKPINDRHGHVIGDKVLLQVAKRLGDEIRTDDTLARFGGDEMVLVMPDTTLAVATTVAERLRAAIANVTDVPFVVTISIGVAELGDGEAAANLLTKADKALYAAKSAGRDMIVAAS